MSWVSTSTTRSSPSVAASSKFGSRAFECAAASSFIFSLMRAMSPCASSLKSTHAGGSDALRPSSPAPSSPPRPMLDELPMAASSKRVDAASRARGEDAPPRPNVCLARSR